MGYVPFELLLMGEDQDTQYICDKFTVSYGISATLYFDQDASALKSVDNLLAVAPKYNNAIDPKRDNYDVMRSGKPEDLGDLPGTKLEIESISGFWNSELLVGSTATESAFKDQSGEFDIVHIATHGMIDPEYGDYSKLAFIADTLNDGFLHAYELKNLDVKAQLVTLSACNTGIGRVAEGEGVMSLARAFRSAGVPSVVTSLWPASDKSTPKLMSHFYENLKNGLPKDLALNNARKQYLKTAVGKARHPYYWGGFILIGDNRKVESSDDNSLLLKVIAVVSIILIISFVYRRYIHSKVPQ